MTLSPYEAAARRLAAIVESSDDAIVSKDLNGVVMSWNNAAERIFGYAADEMIGRSIRLLIPDDRQPEEDETLARIRRGDRVDHFETVRRRKDGTLVPISLTVSPILDSAGVVIGASKIARDISDRVRAAEEREQLLSMAREASRLKDEFLATLSHELRTPLNAILRYVRMIRSGLIDAAKRERAIETIERNATSLSQIVEDILDVSRIIAGKIRLDVKPLDMADVVGAALESTRPAAEAKDISLETYFEPGLEPVHGDAERLQQVVWNLVTNAVKFTNRGGRVTVRVLRTGSGIELKVSDNGAGISPEFLPHIFERFRQGDATTTRQHGGLGLGLAISRHLVEAHGGTLDAASEGLGRGATFTALLPRRAVATADVERSPAPPPAVQPVLAGPPPNLRGVTVVVVDDEPDALRLLTQILETTGANVLAAESADEVLRVVGRERPDVLVADIGLPADTDGVELIARIRRSPDAWVRELPAAALTAFARSEDRTRALKSGFQMHLTKPIAPAELMAAVAVLANKTE
jgi:PAS domain S-box-containing protein